jgi:hypothetical protein
MKADHHLLKRTPENNARTDSPADALKAFPEKLAGAVADLKNRLQAHHERNHPAQTGLVRRAIAEAEARAWELSSFPHLFLPELVEARLAELVALQPACAQRLTPQQSRPAALDPRS